MKRFILAVLCLLLVVIAAAPVWAQTQAGLSRQSHSDGKPQGGAR